MRGVEPNDIKTKSSKEKAMLRRSERTVTSLERKNRKLRRKSLPKGETLRKRGCRRALKRTGQLSTVFCSHHSGMGKLAARLPVDKEQAGGEQDPGPWFGYGFGGTDGTARRLFLPASRNGLTLLFRRT